MANLQEKTKLRNYSNKGRNYPKRFYTALDMAIVKHDEAMVNAQVKRGEFTRTNNRNIYPCGCGVEGCFLHVSRNMPR